MRRQLTDTEKGRVVVAIAIALALVVTVAASTLSKSNALKATDEWMGEESTEEIVEIPEESVEAPEDAETVVYLEDFSNYNFTEEEFSLNEIQEESAGMSSDAYGTFNSKSREEKISYLASLSANDKDLLLRQIANAEHGSYFNMNDDEKAYYLGVFTADEANALVSYFAQYQPQEAPVVEQQEVAQETIPVDPEQAAEALQNVEQLEGKDQQEYINNLSDEEQLAMIELIENGGEIPEAADTSDVKTENETKAEVKEEAKAEVKEEAKAEVKEEAKAEVKEEVKEKTADESLDVLVSNEKAETAEVMTVTAEEEKAADTEEKKTEDTDAKEEKVKTEELKEDESKKEEKKEDTKEEKKGSTDEELEALVNGEELPKDKEKDEEKPEVQKDVKIWYEYIGEPRLGMTVTICSSATGYSDNVNYRWLYSADAGANWQEVEGANGPQHSFILDETNLKYRWRLNVDDVE